MIDELYKDICSALKRVKNVKVYKHNVPQNLETPCFLVTQYSSAHSLGINGRQKSILGIDVLYIPKESHNDEACWNMSENLSRAFRLERFRANNTSFTVDDSVLHMTFDIRAREYKNIEAEKMKQLEYSENIKEA